MDDDVIEDGAVNAALAKIVEGLTGAGLAAALRAGALIVQNAWKGLAPYRTGTYRRSIHVEIETAGETEATAIVGSGITAPPYPTYLEAGNYWVEARNARSLHFVARGGEQVFVKRVFIPAHPSAGPAFDASKDDAVREVESTMKALTGL